MTVKDVIREFEKQPRLHIRVRAVRDYMVSGKLAVKDRIMFYGVELDTDVTRGLLHEYIEPAQGIISAGPCADIYYDRRQPIEWQRLVCCKELLHILDPDQYKTATPEKAKWLIEKIALPPGLENIKAEVEMCGVIA